MNGYVRLQRRDPMVPKALFLAAVLVSSALVCVRAQGTTAARDPVPEAVVAAQLEYQESRQAGLAAEAEAAAATRAIIRAQREYQNARSLAWWRARPLAYAGDTCLAREYTLLSTDD